jgi:DNA primase large subunit
MKALLDKYLPLASNTSKSERSKLNEERQKDHYSHFILRLAFSSTDDLRRRFSRVETTLFRLRFMADDARERSEFVDTLGLDWEVVGEDEKREFGQQLLDVAGAFAKRLRLEDESWFKVDWERVPELVESRKVFLKNGMAYVPGREQMSMVVAEFTGRLDKALEVW